MNLERGGFHFNESVRFSPVKIIPDGGSTVSVVYTPNDWQRTTPVIDKSPEENGSSGMISLQIGREKPVHIRNGEVTVPDGGTVECQLPDQQPIRLEVHRDGSRAMVFDPNHDTKHMHHLDGETPYTATEFPNPLESKMKMWEEKTPSYLNTKQVEQILGWSINTLIKKGFLSPRYEQNSTVKQYTQMDVFRAFLAETVKKENHLFFWSHVNSSALSPLTPKKLLHLREQKEWSDMVKRGRTFGVDLDATVQELVEHMSGR